MVFGLQHQLNVTILVLGWNHYSIGPTKAIKHWIGGLFCVFMAGPQIFNWPEMEVCCWMMRDVLFWLWNNGGFCLVVGHENVLCHLRCPLWSF